MGASKRTVSFPAHAVECAVEAQPVEWEAIESGGYGVVNAHWRVTLADGRAAFVRHALTNEAAEWLRKERLVNESVRGPFMPAYFGAYDQIETTLLVLEDLSRADVAAAVVGRKETCRVARCLARGAAAR